MDRFLLRVYQHELTLQTKFVMIGADHLSQAEAAHDVNGIWFSLQSILVAAANISKLLWAGKLNEHDREDLRNSVGAAPSALVSREVRDDLEHIDVRIDKWFHDPNRRGYVGRNIGPADSIRMDNEPPDYRFGQYDRASGVMSFWDHSTSIRDIVAEARRIHARADVERMKPMK